MKLESTIAICCPSPNPAPACRAPITADWNEYFFALILTGTKSQTVPVAI